MSDKKLEEARRKAASSNDPQDWERVRQLERRYMGPRTRFHCTEIGDFIHIEQINFSDIGMLREIYLDELGVAVAVLDKVKRRSNETAEGPQFCGDIGDNLHIPSTSIVACQPAKDRYGSNFKPW